MGVGVHAQCVRVCMGVGVQGPCVCVCVCAHACMCAWVHACMCVHACRCECVCVTCISVRVTAVQKFAARSALIFYSINTQFLLNCIYLDFFQNTFLFYSVV